MARQPKFTAVAQELQERIESGCYQACAPMPSEQALADEFGVNRLTLRKALGVLADEHLVIRKHGCGTFANPRASRQVMTTVVYVGETQSHFYATFYGALCAEAQDRGKAIMACRPTTETQLTSLGGLLEQHRRLICSESDWPRIGAAVPPDVRVTRVSGFHSIPSLEAITRPAYAVSTDCFRGASLATEHLLALGHRRIAYVDVGHGPGDARLGAVRPQHPPFSGYRSALLQNGCDDEWVIGIRDPGPTEDVSTQEWQGAAVHQFLDACEHPPTGFVCVGDFRAAAVMKVLRERRRRVPADASVVGMGNTPWSEFVDPQLTSVCLGEAEMARIALVFNDEPEPLVSRLVRIEPHLVQRQSTGPAPTP